MDSSTGANEDRPQSNKTSTEDYQIPVADSDVKSILSTIDDAVFVFSVEHTADDLSFTFQWNNSAHESITGMTIDEFQGLRPKEFLGEEQGAEVVNNYRKCVERGATVKYEETLEHETGEVTWHTKLVPVIEDGTVVQIIGMSRDITDLVKRTKQLQVLDRVLRHNLHNDMNIIRGHAETIRDATTGSVADDAETIIAESDRLLDTVDKEREITNLLSAERSSRSIELGTIIDESVAAAREHSPQASITVDRPEEVRAMAIPELSQAIDELLMNALDHSDRDQPTVHIGINETDDRVEIRVTDDGPGIPEMERNVLTGAADIEPLYHGSGLGLWLVQFIVKESDGRLSFEENEPRGSVVVIRLRREPPEMTPE